MANKEVIDLAKKIVELDLLRDQIYENFAEAAGERADELLRKVQNSQRVV
ncbi:hypothetical protein [Robertmurraya kyonggiensis]|nr:hypothetical protein [Robertmurraya kyonggiensis]